jgi:ribosomal protein L11 methyltransferase
MSKASQAGFFLWSKLSDPKWLDAWQERLGHVPGADLVITSVPGKKLARVELYAAVESLLKKIQREWGGSIRAVKSANWAAMSSQTMPDLLIRSSLVVADARSKSQLAAAAKRHPGKALVAIPSDLAFGTGHHATTATVLRFLVDVSKSLVGPWEMADVGCGSGILAIAALRLGASKAWACDFDACAVAVSQENFVRNKVEAEATARCVDVLQWKPRRQWEVVAANIFVDVLEASAAKLVGAVKPGGHLMVSGILSTHAPACLKAFEAQGIGWQSVVRRGKWVSALGRRPAAARPGRRA